jgi:hypothetical protein
VSPSDDSDVTNSLSLKIKIFFVAFISSVLTVFPSEKDTLKKDFLKKILLNIDANPNADSERIISNINKINQRTPTAAEMPIVMARKYTDNSRGDRTGFLNRTMESAPTIPNDNAMLPDITLVIMNVIMGSSVKVAVCAYVVIQRCPKLSNKILNPILDIIKTIAVIISCRCVLKSRIIVSMNASRF